MWRYAKLDRPVEPSYSSTMIVQLLLANGQPDESLLARRPTRHHSDKENITTDLALFQSIPCPKTCRKQEVWAQNRIWHLLLLSSWARCIFPTSLSVRIFIRYGLHPTADMSTILKSDSSASSSWERSVRACSVNVVLERDDAAWILRRRRLSVLFSTLASSHPSGWWKPL